MGLDKIYEIWASRNNLFVYGDTSIVDVTIGNLGINLVWDYVNVKKAQDNIYIFPRYHGFDGNINHTRITFFLQNSCKNCWTAFYIENLLQISAFIFEWTDS